MLKIQEIREIIKLIDQSSIDKFTYEADGAKIKIVKRSNQTENAEPVRVQTTAPEIQATQPSGLEHERTTAKQAEPKETVETQPAPVESAESRVQPTDSSLKSIVSPMVGTFYQSSSPESEPFVKVGQKIGKEDVVCIVEAMKLFNEIEAEVSGEVVEILVKDGQLVEYGQPLFLVKEN